MGTAKQAATSTWSDVDVRDMLAASAISVGAGTPTDAGVSWMSIPEVEHPITMGGGVPDPGTLPVAELQKAIAGALFETPSETLSYGGVVGYEGLREALADRFSRLDGVALDLENFVINNGSAGSINNICDAFVEPGDVVLVESPTFSGSLRTMRGHMADIVAVPLDEQGLDVDAAAEQIRRAKDAGKRVKALYTVTDFHNPTGTTMSTARREALIDMCAEHRVVIVEDAAYAEIYFGEKPPPSLYGMADGQGILKVGTFSKPIATGLRVGWVQGRNDFVKALSEVKFDMGGSPVLLRALAAYVGSGKLSDHLDEMRPLYAAKCKALCDSIEQHCSDYVRFTRPDGGFFLWLDCLGANARDVADAAAKEGLMFPVGSLFYLNGDEDDTSHVRLAFSTASVDDLSQVGPRLRRAFERALD